MSLLKTNTCDCKTNTENGFFSLTVEPISRDVRESSLVGSNDQLAAAREAQELFFPNMKELDVAPLGDGFHVEPDHASQVAHINQLHDILANDNLVARMMITPTKEHTSVAVAITKENVNELVQNGIADISVPMHTGTFRLHSTRPGRITAIEYTC